MSAKNNKRSSTTRTTSDKSDKSPPPKKPALDDGLEEDLRKFNKLSTELKKAGVAEVQPPGHIIKIERESPKKKKKSTSAEAPSSSGNTIKLEQESPKKKKKKSASAEVPSSSPKPAKNCDCDKLRKELETLRKEKETQRKELETLRKEKDTLESQQRLDQSKLATCSMAIKKANENMTEIKAVVRKERLKMFTTLSDAVTNGLINTIADLRKTEEEGNTSSQKGENADNDEEDEEDEDDESEEDDEDEEEYEEEEANTTSPRKGRTMPRRSNAARERSSGYGSDVIRTRRNMSRGSSIGSESGRSGSRGGAGNMDAPVRKASQNLKFIVQMTLAEQGKVKWIRKHKKDTAYMCVCRHLCNTNLMTVRQETSHTKTPHENATPKSEVLYDVDTFDELVRDAGKMDWVKYKKDTKTQPESSDEDDQ
jgi:hypothetical protein